MPHPAHVVFSHCLQHCIAEGGGIDGVDVKRMEQLFLSLA
jgi:hypothetical protein